MKTIRIINYICLATIAAMLIISCTEEDKGPILQDSSTFTGPAFTSPATKEAVEFLPENAANVYENFTWEKSDYGIQLSTNYVLEVDDSTNFNGAQVLVTTSGVSASITIEDFNNAMLALGLPGFEEDTVYLRIKSTINGFESAPLYSGTISRIATTYQSSECGNYCTVGIIGSATPGGWDVDTDMRLADATKADKYTWTVTLYLSVSDVKFRASDAWDVNWGAASFPTGTGVQNGSNIPVNVAGYYKVTFNDATGEYTFTLLSGTVFGAMGIIGPAQAGGWDSDTDLTKDPNDSHLWTATLTLTAGEAKFRADNDWANNWGSNTYPGGVGIGGGPNIAVPVGGTFYIWFNDVTGEYYFMAVGNSQPYSAVGLIGPAQEGGWDSDTDLIKNPANPYLWSKSLTITEGEAKFRANDAWDVNWGSGTFPGGVAIQNGSNIPTKAGTYFITFNSGTGEYYFLK